MCLTVIMDVALDLEKRLTHTTRAISAKFPQNWTILLIKNEMTEKEQDLYNRAKHLLSRVQMKKNCVITASSATFEWARTPAVTSETFVQVYDMDLRWRRCTVQIGNSIICCTCSVYFLLFLQNTENMSQGNSHSHMIPK